MGTRADGTGGPTGRPTAPRESYARLLMNVGGVILVLVGIAWLEFARTRRVTPRPAAEARSTPPAPGVDPVPRAEPDPPPKAAVVEVPPAPPPPEPPRLDRPAVARAEVDLDAASRDRARAEARADEAGRRLRAAAAQAALDARMVKDLAFRVRDPSARVAAASARGGFLKSEREKVKTELDAIARVPRPTVKVLANKNPVARPAEGAEHHFELRRNRITYIDLERLLDKVKSDALLRIRLSDGARAVNARVGPVGAFSLDYTLGRSLPAGLDDLVERRGVRYDLRGWEIVPEFEGRGETFETTRQPISEFTRVLNRLNPERNSITLWVYADSYPLFRKLRDDLHARGFLVAARPLPEGIAIRGSPSGSLSAGQ